MMTLRPSLTGGGQSPLLSKAKLLFTVFIVLLLSSCGEFGGFSDFSKAETGDIQKVEAYFTEENLAKFYDSVSQPEEDYAQCTVTLSGDKKTYQGWMKVRGYTSRGEPKKNFTLQIKVGDEKIKYALMHEADTWFKNRIVMYAYNNYVYNGASLTAAPDTAPVALFVNGEYLGYYVRVDMYEEKQLNRYKKGNMSELFKVFINHFDSNPLYETTEKKFPKDKNFSSLELLVTNLNRMSDAEWNAWVEKYIDIDDFIRYMVVHNYFGVEDTEAQNYYIYNYGKMVFLPWDNELGMKLEYDCFLGNNKLVKRILAVPSVKAAYAQAMKDFVADTDFLDTLKAKVAEWYDESFDAIKNDPIFYYTVKDAEKSRDYIIDFINRRGTSAAYTRHFQ